ncbi:MAG: cation:dicarboxylase symporter family transporter [Proteobacteria bacterium]|nr:cation:dicarboxylase symporter family transporter [Pseudomonadota bacterium]
MSLLTKIENTISQRSAQVLLVLLAYFSFVDHIPMVWQQGFLTFSTLIKDCLMWVIPAAVTFFIAATIRSFERRAPVLILSLLVFEICSNVLSVTYGALCAGLSQSFVTLAPISDSGAALPLLWRLGVKIPSWWAADKGAILGVTLGLVAAFARTPHLDEALRRGAHLFTTLLTKGFARLIPLFVLGFVAQMYHKGLVAQLSSFAPLLIALVIFIVLYVSFLFLVSAAGVRNWWSHVRNLLPAGAIALTSGCSLSTMPWTIKGAAKNMESPELAQAVIPATTNFQQIGDAIANAFFCFLIYTHFMGHTPSVSVWSIFTVAFVMGRFAATAMLGGAIFVMLPIYIKYLNFSAEMVTLILALNVLFDPIITSSNVMANGALCRVFERAWQRVQHFAGAKAAPSLS